MQIVLSQDDAFHTFPPRAIETETDILINEKKKGESI